MKAEVIHEGLIIPRTGNAAALLLEWCFEFAKCPIKDTWLYNENYIMIELNLSKEHYQYAATFINSNL